MNPVFSIGVILSLIATRLHADTPPRVFPKGPAADVVFTEVDGVVAVEAEHFATHNKDDVRKWHLTTTEMEREPVDNDDPPHAAGASGGAYLELLPDTRRTHADKLIRGENFAPEPGRMAILSYRVRFETAGRYYVWVRAYSTGSEDNGIHVGIDGTWPASGARMQWCEGKRTWRWESRQRTAEQHCGVPHAIYLDVEKPGEHLVTFSMREDGFEFDKWLMTTDRNFARPKGIGPKPVVSWGKLPRTYPFVAAKPVEPSSSAVAADRPIVVQPRGKDGDGSVTVSPDAKQWNPVTLTLDGPFAHERDSSPSAFRDYELKVTFEHESGDLKYVVPGYFAADGDAANTGAESGTKWRVHLLPDLPGRWTYEVEFRTGRGLVTSPLIDHPTVEPFHGTSGTFTVAPIAEDASPVRRRGRLEYVGKRYLRFAGTEEWFLKCGPDAPETLLAYADFDGTIARKENVPLKTWQPHVRDWRPGDPTWRNGKGKGLVGAVNYLAEAGCNTVSFLPYNAGGDGDNVWPHVGHDDKLRFDCSKLDQWGIVFDHATERGLYLHFKLQEQENDDRLRGHNEQPTRPVPDALDGGDLGPQRKLYCRELVARFGHALALNWNLGEENTQSPEQQRAMAAYLREIDPYDHHIVVHTFPDRQDAVYPPLLGEKSVLTGASLQNSWDAAHPRTLKWIRESEKAGRPWVCCNDEQGPAGLGVPPDPGYEGHSGIAEEKGKRYDLHDIRKLCLWGTLMAGGGGVEYYFGYKLPQNDLVCEDFRSRAKSWEYGRIATTFLGGLEVPVVEMACHDELVGNPSHGNDRFCLAKPGTLYLVYLPDGGPATLDLSAAKGDFTVTWFDPRNGGDERPGSTRAVTTGGTVDLGKPPTDPKRDWLAIVRFGQGE